MLKGGGRKMFRFEMKGFKELQKKLNDLQRNIKSIEGEQKVSFDELFTQDFIKRCSHFESLEDLFKKSGFVINSQEDLQKIPDKEWDDFIASNTRFKDWKEMLDSAVNEWTRKKLGL